MYIKKLVGDNRYVPREGTEMDKSNGSSHLKYRSQVSFLRGQETSGQQRELN